jgi:ribonucleoside-triphosphate reductase
MIRLTEEQINKHVEWMDKYVDAENASTASTMDSNANVTKKTLATLDAEIAKGLKVQVNRAKIKSYITKRFGADLAEQYTKDLESHLIYTHDETSLMPYCVSISLAPFLWEGMTGLNKDGSEAPEHLRSFCGGYVNLVQYVASQFAGAVATPEFLSCFDYFARKDFGDNYLETNLDVITQELQGVVYLLNQDASARAGQSVFLNFSTFDKGFFDGIIADTSYPDMTKPKWGTINALQKFFYTWFQKEREKKFLTFPVMTNSAIIKDGDWVDQENKNMIAEQYSKGMRPFLYTSETADSLSSCCRLQNPLGENRGVSTGSKNVITINMNRLYQEGYAVEDVVVRVNKYNLCFNDFFTDMFNAGMLPVYDAGFISLDKQFLTVGINGFSEGARYLGHEISANDRYIDFASMVFGSIKKINEEMSAKFDVKFGTEFVPAESLGVKNAKWDKADNLETYGDCYNSYLYLPSDSVNYVDKMTMHGRSVCKNLDGGQAVHDNESDVLTVEQYLKKFESLAVLGCNYYTENVKETCCNSCGYNDIHTTKKCSKCGSTDIDYATKIIGYVKRVKAFSLDRQSEEATRNYA